MATIGRPKAAVVVTDAERTELMRVTNRAHVNRALALRARLVLACAEPATNTAVARRHWTTNATVGKWRTRFLNARMAGPYDEPRVGAPRTISDDAVEAVIVRTLETLPQGATHWSTRTMAAKAGMSHTMVGRIWRTFGLKPHIARSFTISPDSNWRPESGCRRLVHEPPDQIGGVLLRREVADLDARASPTNLADGLRPARTPDPQLHPEWHARPVPRTQRRHR
jgi:hypothetical protein